MPEIPCLFFPPQIHITAPSPFQNENIHRRYFPHIPRRHFMFSATKLTKDSDAGERQQMTTLKSITGKPEV